MGYGYDGNGALSTVRYPDGDIVAYNPDALGRPTTVGNYASAITWFPDGDLKSYSLASGGTFLAQKNARNLLSNFTFGKGGVPTVSEDLGYDAVGNIGSISDLAGNGQRTKVLGYDGLNRLLSATAGNLWGTESYTYDTLNNMRSLTRADGTAIYDYDGANRLASVRVGASTVHSFLYDARGNTVDKDGDVLHFDLANRLVGIEGKGDYTYDAAGRRVKKATSQGTTYYAYNAAGQLMWELDPATRQGSGYVYLGNKLIAKASENIDILRPNQVRTALGVIGMPGLAASGSTIDVTLDIVNSGTRTLSADSQYPVQMGYHFIDGAGGEVEANGSVNIPADIPVGAHGTITMHVPAAAVLGTGKRVRFSLLQAGVGWFKDWPGNGTVEIGPYSACPTPGTGNLCNNVTGLTPAQTNVALTLVSGPSLSADGRTVTASIDIANHGTVTLASAAPHPVKLGNHLADAAGNIIVNDVIREAIPEIAPGQHAAVTIATPADQLLGSGRRVQFELVQEGLHWFRDFGFAPISAGPYATLSGPTNNANGTYTLSWQPIAGVTGYNLQESVNDATWTTVSASAVGSWSTSGRATGTYGYRVQACASGGCAPFGPTWTVTVLLPPPVPASAAASAPIVGPVSLHWATSATAARYLVIQQVNGGTWTTVYDGPGTDATFGTPVSGSYAYQVQACNASGCSGYRASNAVNIVLPPTAAPGIGGGGINHTGAYAISWTGVPAAAVYNLYESVNGAGWQLIQSNASGSWGTAGRSDGTYAYQVQACNAGGCGPMSAVTTVSVALPPPSPANVLLHERLINSKRMERKLTWNATPLTTYYEIFDWTIQQTKVTPIPASTLAMVVENDYIESMPYHDYQLRACNPVGCSAWVTPWNASN